MTYIPLHAHSAEGSIGDSVLPVEAYVKAAKEKNLPAVALTDHGSMASMYRFYRAAKKEGIKPIIGCEVYESSNRHNKDPKDPNSRTNWHLLLLAKNNQGLSNLLKIVNDAESSGKYYKPRTDISMLKRYGKGIIATSACVGGRIPKLLEAGKREEAIEVLEQYKEAFDAFYLEIQPGDFKLQKYINHELLLLAEETDTPLVTTNDIHYLESKDWVAHDAHVKIARKQKFDTPPIYPAKDYWFMNEEDVVQAYGGSIPKKALEESLKNTVRISEACDVTLNQDTHMPVFPVKGDSSEELELTLRCLDALESIKDSVAQPAEYVSRTLYELDVIQSLGFSGYFLMVQDFIDFAKEKGIAVGPGRGSVGGSLVAYLLGITLADPVRYGLIFERFLSPHRASIPDIDIDFDSERRHEVIEYAVEKYGPEKCALVSTFQMRKSKNAIRSAARILDIEESLADKAAKLIPAVYYDDEGEKMTDLSIEESLNVSADLRSMQADYPEMFDLASKVSNVPFSRGIHPAGVLVTPVVLSDHIPLIPSGKEGIFATSLSLDDAEMAGMVKFDFLSLASLNVYEKTQHDIGEYFDVLSSSFDDKAVWDLVGSKYTTGLFQISSQTYKSRMPRLKPKSIPELAHCLALLRGPCISSGQDRVYMDILSGKKQVDPIHPLYYKATEDTLGILLYQEQLMALAVNFGFSLEDGYTLVKAVSKKKMSSLKSFEDAFFKKALERNVPEKVIQKIWATILDAGQYSFNRGHAVAYAVLSYISAHLKAHHPDVFLTNLLTNAYRRKKAEEASEAIQDCQRLGIKFLPLDVNKSSWDFTLENGAIRIGFVAVKGFGEAASHAIADQRPYVSIEDFMSRVTKSSCNIRNIVSGTFGGMFSSLGFTNKDAYLRVMQIRKQDPDTNIRLAKHSVIDIEATEEEHEEVVYGNALVSSSVNALPSTNYFDISSNKTTTVVAKIKEIKQIKDRKGQKMAFLTLSTSLGFVEGALFHSSFVDYKDMIKKSAVFAFTVKKTTDEKCVIKSIKERV